MDVTVVVAGKEKKVVLSTGGTVEDVLIKAGINPQMVLVRTEDRIVPDTTKVADGERFYILRVVSGG